MIKQTGRLVGACRFVLAGDGLTLTILGALCFSDAGELVVFKIQLIAHVHAKGQQRDGDF